MLTDLQEVESLIRSFEDAIAYHDKIFGEDAPQPECEAALGPMSDALIAICAARPISLEGRQRRREYLSERLFEETDGCPGLIKAVYAALLAEPVDTADRGEN